LALYGSALEVSCLQSQIALFQLVNIPEVQLTAFKEQKKLAELNSPAFPGREKKVSRKKCLQRNNQISNLAYVSGGRRSSQRAQKKSTRNNKTISLQSQ